MRFIGRVTAGFAAFCAAFLAPLTPALAQTQIELRVPAPAELGGESFVPAQPIMTDELASFVGNSLEADALIQVLTAGTGVPDIAPGDPGDLDLPPGYRAFDIMPFGPDANGDGTPDQATIALGTFGDGQQTVAADATVDTIGGGSSFLQGQCGGVAISYDADGAVIDAAVGVGATRDGLLLDVSGDGRGERAFTTSNPFEVRADGQVVYSGYLPYTGGEGPLDHVWKITTGGLSVDSGGDDNPDANNANAGIVNLGESIPAPARFTGTFVVQGWLFSQNGRFCVAEGHVQFTGPFPLFTAPGALGTIVGFAGIAGLLFNARPAQTFRV